MLPAQHFQERRTCKQAPSPCQHWSQTWLIKGPSACRAGGKGEEHLWQGMCDESSHRFKHNYQHVEQTWQRGKERGWEKVTDFPSLLQKFSSWACGQVPSGGQLLSPCSEGPRPPALPTVLQQHLSRVPALGHAVHILGTIKGSREDNQGLNPSFKFSVGLSQHFQSHYHRAQAEQSCRGLVLSLQQW